MRIFIDTAPFIYLIEEHPEFSHPVKDLFLEYVTNNDSLISSVVKLAKFGVGPEKAGRPDIILKFEQFLRKLGIQILDINQEIARKSYQLRAKYPFLKGMDALQIAAALVNSCDSFLTNDVKLNSVKEIKTITLMK
ncbi:MAG: PIN domain-containing protein [Lewinellaceae bacterium]|nr:PIN domain-containing protein [Lewinella sp.]MCB9281081.1 PIN domain-containing protein [Lewinellaceae bacterium]